MVATNDYFVFVGQLFEHFSESLELLGFGPVCDVSSMDEEVSSREIFQLQFLESVVGVWDGGYPDHPLAVLGLHLY